MGIIVTAAVVYWQFKRLHSVVNTLKKLYLKSLRVIINGSIYRLLKKNTTKFERKLILKGITVNDVDTSEVGKAEDAAEKLMIDGLFQLLDEDGSDILDEREFEHLFQLLDISLPANKVRLMFSYCDYQGTNDGNVTKEEFLDAWSWLEEQLADAFAREHGVSQGDIVWMCIQLGLGLIFFILFLLAGMATWNTEGSFAAVINSLLVGTIGVGATELRKRPKGEELVESSPEEVKDLVARSLAYKKS